ncbi:MAG: ABC-F family ATP-binding cassette domain-containing protein [Rickettsia sp.]|nr:ABC-F family ATP-binding cassette domain-containing protein [Rickettsia sp.]
MYPLFYVKNANFYFGKKTILDKVAFNIYQGDKICLIGKNGSGKSTLLKIINNDLQLDEGEIFKNRNISIGYLQQENILQQKQNAIEFLMTDLEKTEISEINKIVENLDINTTNSINHLSGGEIKKILLAKILSQKPDILLLDEPTNHLDIKAIEWLEKFVLSYHGSIICISHDKIFLKNISNKIFWLHQTHLYKSEERGFEYFDQWQEEIIQQEEVKLKKINQKLQTEQQWLLTGISARRKRNQKRLKDLYQLRNNLKITQEKLLKNKLKISQDIQNNAKVKRILEISSISFQIKEKIFFSNFSMDILKGEKIGIIGPNGSGKTSFLQIIQKKLLPTKGFVKHGVGINISYFDQQKKNLNLDLSIAENLSPGGSEYILVNDKLLHIRSYIKNFMFDPKSLHEKIKLFSGGELTRLSLAKTFINTGNILILDEPTNDLDLDSLEMLVEMLSDYQGTVIIVSHNRDFIDQIVTKSLVFDGEKITKHIGLYQKNFASQKKKISSKIIKNKDLVQKEKSKLSYKDKRLLEILPSEIENLEKEINVLEKELSKEDLFSQDYQKFISLTQKLEELQKLLDLKYKDWIRIDNLNANLQS